MIVEVLVLNQPDISATGRFVRYGRTNRPTDVWVDDAIGRGTVADCITTWVISVFVTPKKVSDASATSVHSAAP
jgi:hypothetical protein